MKKPNLDQLWETFIRIPISKGQKIQEHDFKTLYDLIRFRIKPLILDLKWFCFLIHTRYNGVPTTEDDNNLYFHIRFEPKQKASQMDLLKSLPDYCLMTRKIQPSWIEQISVGKGITFDTTLLKCKEISEVWKIIGEQSAWLLNTLDIFKEEIEISPYLVSQFLHYFSNMTLLQIK